MDSFLTIHRQIYTDKSTTSNLYFNGQWLSYALEDKDRGLHQLMSPGDVAAIKIPKATAIPYGFYEVTITMSDRFKRLLPLVNNVTGFSGIRLHPGNGPDDTEGCILPGTMKGKVDEVQMSRIAFDLIFGKLDAALKSGRVFLTVTR